MATDKKEAPIPKRATTATTRLVQVPLNEFKFDEHRYCHRDQDALSEPSLKALADSRAQEGPQNPPEFFTDDDGNRIVTKGHCRIMADRALARNQTPGYAEDMLIEAFEVIGASPQDLLIRSVADNEVRKDLTRVERIRVAKKLYDNGVPLDRAARAMGVSDQTFGRDLLIAQNGWMFEHLIDGSIQPNAAVVLLEAAKKVGRLKELKEDLDLWVADKKRLVREKEKLLNAQNKQMRPADKEVKKFMSPHLVAHWVELLRKGRRFDEDAQWKFTAGVDADNDQLRISGVTMDLNKDPFDRMVTVGSQLSQTLKELGRYLQKRQKMERDKGPAQAQQSPYDFQYLRDLGLDEEADMMESRYQRELADRVDGEDDPAHGQVNERVEEDLAEQIELPQTEQAPEEPTVDQPVEAKEEPPAVVEKPPVEKKDTPVAKKSEGPTPKGKGKEKA